MREHSLQQVHILTDASTVYNNYIYLLMCQHSLQVHILTDVSTVYSKYIHLLMRQHNLQQVHIRTDGSTQSTTSTYT